MNKKSSNKLKKTIIKKSSNKLKKIIIVMMIFLVAASVLFALTSFKSDNQKASEGENNTIAGISAAETTIAAGTSITNQDTISENETATKTKGSSTETTAPAETASQTTTLQTLQTIIVIAKGGGYSPRKIEAKAGVPTILTMKSEGAYGCERAFYIPDLNIGKSLPENGQTQFDLGVHAQGTKLVGVCGMGMYYFQIIFN
ncbi:MAG: cupredoxin domain-containing protein [Candidatus Humimicrobiaceae bacterium]